MIGKKELEISADDGIKSHFFILFSISVKFTFGRSSGKISLASRLRSSAVLTRRLPAFLTITDWPGRSGLPDWDFLLMFPTYPWTDEVQERTPLTGLNRQPNRHRADASACCVKDSIGDGWRDRNDRCFPGSRRWEIRPIEQMNVYFRHIIEARHLVLAE